MKTMKIRERGTKPVMAMANGGMAQGYMNGGMVQGYADGGYVDNGTVALHRQYPGFEAPNSPCHTLGPGVRSLQDYKK